MIEDGIVDVLDGLIYLGMDDLMFLFVLHYKKRIIYTVILVVVLLKNHMKTMNGKKQK